MIQTASGIGKNFAYEWHTIFGIYNVFQNILIFIEYYMINRISWTNACYLFETVSMLHSSTNNYGSDDASTEHTDQINFHKMLVEKTNDRTTMRVESTSRSAEAG